MSPEQQLQSLLYLAMVLCLTARLDRGGFPAAGRRHWLHRLILYLSLSLYLFLMGVFFIWGYAE